MVNTLYDVLEVIPTASAETIQAAYRSLINRYHPDKVATLGPDLQAAAIARTKEINFAYDILSDMASRTRYDQELRGDPDEAPSLLPRGAVIDSPGPRIVRPATPPRRGPRAAVADGTPPRRHVLAALASAIAGIALILVVPQAANLIFSAAEYSLTGHSRFFYDAETPVDARGNFGSSYLPVLWGWLFANYLFGLICYRLAVAVGEGTARRFGGSFAATNDRLFLFLTFVVVVAVSELFFLRHTMGDMLAAMFILAGAYLAERGIR
jgi:hypothetical protein